MPTIGSLLPLERYLEKVRTEDAGAEEPAASRERLKGRFPAGSTRRMTQLGLLVGAALADLDLREDDAVVYASAHGENRALEGYLETFPAASPTLFQVSIHPSAVQQALIGRQQRVGDFFPLSGDDGLVAQALVHAFLTPAPRAIFCGGEERGTWLVECGLSSERSFGFAVALARDRTSGSVGRLSLAPAAGNGNGGCHGPFPLVAWFDLLHARRPFSGTVEPGWRLELSWS